MDFTRTTRSILFIALIASLLGMVYTLVLFFVMDDWRYLVLEGNNLVLTIFAAGAFLRRRTDQMRQAVWMLILIAELTFIVPTIVFANASLLFAPAIFILVIPISLLTVLRQEHRRVMVTVFVSALINLAMDQFLPFERPPLPAPMSVGIGALIATAILLDTFYFFRAFRNLNLQTKTTMLIATLLVLAVVLVSAFNILYTRAILLQEAQNSLYNAADNTAASIDNLIFSTLATLRAEAQTPFMREVLTLSPQAPDYLHEIEETKGMLLSYKDKDPYFISSYALLNVQGKVLVSTAEEEIGTDESQRDYFQKPLQDKLPFFSIWYSENSLYFSAPVRDENNAVIGVLRARYSAAVLQQVIAKSSGLAGEETFAVLFDEHHLILAHGLDSSLIFKSLVSLDANLLTAWQKEGRYPPGDASTFTVHLPEMAERLNQADRQPFFEVTDAQDIRQQVAAVRLNQQPWTLIFAQPQQVFLAPVNRQITRSILVTIGAAFLSVYLSLILSRLLTNPILHLTDTARQIAAGDLAQRAVVTSGDEIGVLAQTFNEMTSRLGDLITNLEQRVAERTHDLELRSSYLQNTAEVGRAISATLDPQDLMQQAVNLIQERFHLYYVGLFELDGSGEWANLRAGTGEAGRAMLERGHRIRVNAGMIGWSIANNRPRIAQQAELDEVRLRPPELPNTRSEAALPLRARGQILGALSIQSDQPNFFNEDNLAIFQILADQIAIAMENARLFAESRAALEGLQRLSIRQTQEAWNAMVRQAATLLAIRADGHNVTPVPPRLDRAMRQALEKGEITLALNEQASDSSQMLIIPIKVRGVVVGALRTYKPLDQGKWTETEIQTLNTIVERLALALDNARLLRESQRRAERERLVSEITNKIRSYNDPQVMIETALQELRQALGASRVEILPRKTSDGKEK